MLGNALSMLSYITDQVLGFTNLDINTATFDTLDAIPEYKSIGARQWGSKIANNTAYNNRHSDQNLFVENDEYASPTSDKTYDTDRDYRNKFLKLEVGLSSSAFTMPFAINSAGDILTTEWIQITTTFQTLPFTSQIQIRAENSGGFTLRLTVPGTRFLLGSITELRKTTGA